MRKLAVTMLTGSALVATVACAPVQNQRGYVPNQEAITSIQVGTDTKEMVSMKLGEPSTLATFGGDTWYYISAQVEQNAFFAPRAIERNILAVEFGGDGKVTGLQRFTLADGRIVDFQTRETPTRGRTLTILQQFFNAVPGNIGTPGQNQGPGGPNAPVPGPNPLPPGGR
jgi:outer membrane protein assembly factor BamE (lipoprotein component of BamABCDE complex)